MRSARFNAPGTRTCWKVEWPRMILHFRRGNLILCFFPILIELCAGNGSMVYDRRQYVPCRTEYAYMPSAGNANRVPLIRLTPLSIIIQCSMLMNLRKCRVKCSVPIYKWILVAKNIIRSNKIVRTLLSNSRRMVKLPNNLIGA